MYIKETCIINGVKEIDKYKCMRVYKKGEKRAKKTLPTSEKQKKVNIRNAKKQKQRIIKANFTKGDLFVTLTYMKEHKPKTKDEALEDKKLFIGRMRASLIRRGLDFKYCSITEIGTKGAVHHHMLIKKCDAELISKHWKKGGVHFKFIYSEDVSKLARYLSGDKEVEGDWEKHECAFEKWSHSRNLIIPEVTKEHIHAKDFSKTPRAEKGYRVEELRQGSTEWGYEWQSYKLVPNTNITNTITEDVIKDKTAMQKIPPKPKTYKKAKKEKENKTSRDSKN